ncbi:hypothetical protein Ancab_022271 [Ancistrocladus abbreviatus]
MELMLLGFISLLLTVFQGAISKICIPEKYVVHMLPCSLSEKKESNGTSTSERTGHLRRLLAEGSISQEAYCASKVRIHTSAIQLPMLVW